MNSEDERVRKAYELGFTYEKQYRGCSQCTLRAVLDALGLENADVLRSASSLATGGGLLGCGSCGGFTGGQMAMSLLFGRRQEHMDGDDDFKYTSFRMARELQERFVEEYGTVICNDIHQRIFGRTYDLLDPEDKQQFNDDGAHTDKCTSVVANAAAWSTRIILEEVERRGTTIEELYDQRNR